MKIDEGQIKYNESLHCYGMMGLDGNWVKEKLEDGDRIDVVINGERFITYFEQSPYSPTPVLRPQVWSNWKFLCELPAAYYDPEKPKSEPLSPKEERRLRYKYGLIMILLSLVASIVLGALFSLFRLGQDSYFHLLVTTSKVMFLLFGAGIAAGGLLLIGKIVPENLCIGFGCALYYGTIILSSFLSKNILTRYETQELFLISFVIVSLSCYIHWLKNYKPSN